MSEDLSENSRREILKDFDGIPMVRRYVTTELESLFYANGIKIVGFKKSPLAQSILREMKPYRLNHRES